MILASPTGSGAGDEEGGGGVEDELEEGAFEVEGMRALLLF